MNTNTSFLLTSPAPGGYDNQVTAKSMTRAWSLEQRWTDNHHDFVIGGFFVPQPLPSLARLAGGRKACRTSVRSTNLPFAPFLFGRKKGVTSTLNRGETL